MLLGTEHEGIAGAHVVLAFIAPERADLSQKHEATSVNDEACLLLKLAHSGLKGSLTGLNVPTRELPHVGLTVFADALAHAKQTVTVEDDADAFG
jgi:hypothetical protein